MAFVRADAPPDQVRPAALRLDRELGIGQPGPGQPDGIGVALGQVFLRLPGVGDPAAEDNGCTDCRFDDRSLFDQRHVPAVVIPRIDVGDRVRPLPAGERPGRDAEVLNAAFDQLRDGGHVVRGETAWYEFRAVDPQPDHHVLTDLRAHLSQDLVEEAEALLG
jgi:hypothetical protein